MIKTYNKIESIIKQVNLGMARVISEDLPFFKKIKDFTINSGGKRARPILTTLLSSNFGKLDNDVFDLAAVVEIIHAASLLHDDVLDDADERRGQKSARRIFGNKEVILAGDYLLACAIKRLNKFKNQDLIDIFIEIIRQLSLAEILQMDTKQNLDLDIQVYMKIIYGKTASLFEGACRSAAILNNLSSQEQNEISKWGQDLGYLFQMRDDYLDYFYPEVLNKTPMQDYINGQVTWPILIAKSRAGLNLEEYFSNNSKQSTSPSSFKILSILNESGVEEICRNEITKRVDSLLMYINSLGDNWQLSTIILQLKKLYLPSSLPLGQR